VARRVAAAAAFLTVLPAISLTATSITAGPAHAATTVFKVIGTADVSDSKLMADLIEPQFEAAYPQYDLQYTPMGTGEALDAAKTGVYSASIVHAASIENQFVADGYSLEPAGRSLFWGDFVLLGPASDPAGVLSGANHDVVAAFEKIAAAGAAGHATFISRGTKAGTVVQEHQLWALSNGVPLCTETAANGGGSAPSNTPGACPAALNDTDYPDWYAVTGVGQAGNVQAADLCPTATYPNGNCYVFTDRGTYAYLKATNAISNLQVVTRSNDPNARGGTDALYNFFHAYAINPAAIPAGPGNQVDTVAGKLFLDFITSPAEQQAMGNYLNGTNDGPFIPAAAPKLTTSLKGGQVKVGKKSTITGQLTNNMPGYPALNGVTVNLLEAASSSPLAIPKIVAQATTDATGGYAIKAELRGGKFYSVGVGSITKVEKPELNPPFSDILQPTTTSLGQASSVKISSAKVNNHKVVVVGKVKPKSADKHGKVTLYAKKAGHKLVKIGKAKIKKGKKSFTIRANLGAGTWKLQAVYSDGTVVLESVSGKKTVKVS
jgi:ABC-type tungstate transport system permease subunit